MDLRLKLPTPTKGKILYFPFTLAIAQKLEQMHLQEVLEVVNQCPDTVANMADTPIGGNITVYHPGADREFILFYVNGKFVADLDTLDQPVHVDAPETAQSAEIINIWKYMK